MVPPEIVSINPNFGAEGAEIEVSGSYFGSKKPSVYMGTKKCKVVSWDMDTIRFVVPKKMAPGTTYDVTVTNKVGSVTLVNGFPVE